MSAGAHSGMEESSLSWQPGQSRSGIHFQNQALFTLLADVSNTTWSYHQKRSKNKRVEFWSAAFSMISPIVRFLSIALTKRLSAAANAGVRELNVLVNLLVIPSCGLSYKDQRALQFDRLTHTAATMNIVIVKVKQATRVITKVSALKLCAATSKAAARFRCPVPSDITFRRRAS